MLRIVVDSGSSIKQDERELYGVDILPLRVQMGNDNFLDGVDLSIDEFYDNLIPSIACHWGPNAFGYIYVKGN